jgi:periplasmic protein TonB
MTMMLRRAILVSILVHLAVLSSFRQPVLLPDMTTRAAPRAINAQLHSAEFPKPESPPFESLSAPAEKSVVAASEALKKPGSEKKALVLPSFSRSTATEDVAVTDRAVVFSGEAARASSAGAGQAEKLDLDGVRQYRLSLAREARRFKRYPDQAREQGREGVVVVVVTTVAGVAIPQVTVSQSSGSDLLDQAALELLDIAVQTATLPESLSGQQFGLTLPIHYRLDD